MCIRDSSIRASEVICPICVCCVIMRYCKIAPEAMIPFLRCSTPNPFRFFTSKDVYKRQHQSEVQGLLFDMIAAAEDQNIDIPTSRMVAEKFK